MNTGKMKLNMEQLEQVSGAVYCSESVPGPDYSSCRHPNKVKTPWWGREDDYIFWSQHQNAYLCPDCKKIVWVNEDP